MSKNQNAKIIFVEGETEYALFQKMKQKGLIKFKKIVKKNFWVDDIKKYAVNIPKNCDLIVVFDSDVIDRVDRFIQNVNYLASRKHSIFLLQQTRNFEEEIAYCCSVTLNKLIASFCKCKTSGVADFKRDFISSSNPFDKLVALGINQDKWFKRELHHSLLSLSKYKSDFSTYFNADVINL
ncbi:hypothetical protein [Escherichia coli]|nr:hypothetical protein [Escherichia coli]EFN8599047.1 hypothetical protein [Escherichia coli O79:H40]EEV5956314.1 hypothetical protein [Escherichia coli]EEZ9068140.1 hypothetical protein [Escherichia coli]EFB1661561.1 hypothetical protein [Escherichia coli]EFC1480480.1 hypothetical protein [Escherichia coli]